MDYEKMMDIVHKLQKIVMIPFEFNGIRFEVNYASRAKHSRSWMIHAHHHPWFEFNYVYKGSVFTQINDTEFLVKRKASYIIAPGVVHSHRNSSEGDDGICIRFSMDTVFENKAGKMLYDSLNCASEFPFEINLEVLETAKSITAIQAAFLNIIMQVYDIWNNEKEHYPRKGKISDQVMLYLAEYYKDKISVNDIANAVNISYRTLSRKFREETGKTVSEALSKIRIEKSKELLVGSNMPIYEIALEAGFENEYYFSNAFKAKEGVSPSKFRKARIDLK